MAKKIVESSITLIRGVNRPNNVTPYAIGDVIDDIGSGGIQTIFPAARGAGGSGRITDGIMISFANQATTPQINLWLFDTAVASHEADNVAFTPTDDDLRNLVGVVQFVTAIVGDAGSGADGNLVAPAARTFLPVGFQCIAGSKNLHATFVLANAYTPVALEKFFIRLSIEQD